MQQSRPDKQPTPRKYSLILKGPSLQSALDAREVHVILASRHSFTIKIQSVTMNLSISSIHYLLQVYSGTHNEVTHNEVCQREADWWCMCSDRHVSVNVRQ